MMIRQKIAICLTTYALSRSGTSGVIVVKSIAPLKGLITGTSVEYAKTKALRKAEIMTVRNARCAP